MAIKHKFNSYVLNFEPDAGLLRNTHVGQAVKFCFSQTEMDLNTKRTTSRALLSCDSAGGVGEKLLLKPKAGISLQTERIPRSSVIDKLQNFLPQMAEANKKLMQQIEEGAAGRFDIENVEEAERIIKMDVALVELDGSDSSSEGDEKTDSEDDDSEITEQNLKLPGDKGKRKKVKIQVLEQQGE